MILEPEKRRNVVLINKTDYYNSLERLFFDKTKFEFGNDDPILSNLSTTENYLQLLFSRGEITKEQKKEMRPKFSQIGLSQFSHFDTLPSFRPIADTTNSPHYGIGQFLAKLLNPLTQNENSDEDSFETVKVIHKNPDELFDQGY